jgi:acetyltransferase-like isoleucine patch superfamily enzyme
MQSKKAEWARAHKESKLVSLLIQIYFLLRSVNHVAVALTGYVPIHTVRLLLYKYLFRVEVPFDAVIFNRCRYIEPAGVHIGHHSIIGSYAYLDGRMGLFIGSNVNIGDEVRIFTLEHDITSSNFATKGGAVYIDDWVYVGARVTILPSVRIGAGAVVASGAVVTKDVEPWTMVGGVPARFIKKRPIVQYTLNTKPNMLRFLR